MQLFKPRDTRLCFTDGNERNRVVTDGGWYPAGQAKSGLPVRSAFATSAVVWLCGCVDWQGLPHASAPDQAVSSTCRRRPIELLDKRK